jgi:PTS system nitrogen regulatory IIA component
MSELVEILPTNQIYLDVEVKDINGLFSLASSQFASVTELPEKLIYECLQARESLGSTGLGVGVAIPHGRVKGLKEAHASFYRLSKGIDFKTSDQIAVDIVIFLLVPEAATQKHLELLSEIAQVLADKSKRSLLREITSVDNILSEMTNRTH